MPRSVYFYSEPSYPKWIRHRWLHTDISIETSGGITLTPSQIIPLSVFRDGGTYKVGYRGIIYPITKSTMKYIMDNSFFCSNYYEIYEWYDDNGFEYVSFDILVKRRTSGGLMDLTNGLISRRFYRREIKQVALAKAELVDSVAYEFMQKNPDISRVYMGWAKMTHEIWLLLRDRIKGGHLRIASTRYTFDFIFLKEDDIMLLKINGFPVTDKRFIEHD